MKKAFTVYQVNNYIKSLLDEDIVLSDIYIMGEISNFKYHTSGHMYFSLKDEYATISCVMFKNYAKDLKFNLENGMKVILQGRISLYEKTGNYQIYVEHVEPAGKGAMQIAFEQLKEKLAKEGFFDKDNKKNLPKNPTTIALLTSPTGAVVQDMINITKRRNPAVNLLIVPTQMQGVDAVSSITEGIYDINAWGKADIIIIARGGGSAEDLWTFNEEAVARAVFNCTIPVISAIGHETDFTIIDFVADIRAATPTAAIEICLPDKKQEIEHIESLVRFMHMLVEGQLGADKEKLHRLISRRAFAEPLEGIYNKQVYLDGLRKMLNSGQEVILLNEKARMQLLNAGLSNLSPLNVLEKGYSIVSRDGVVVRSAMDVRDGDALQIRFRDGIVSFYVYSELQG